MKTISWSLFLVIAICGMLRVSAQGLGDFSGREHAYPLGDEAKRLLSQDEDYQYFEGVRRGLAQMDEAREQMLSAGYYSIGRRYNKRRLGKERIKAGFHCLEIAGHLGHVKAMRTLGNMFISEVLGFEPIDALAAYWYERAAELGDIDSQLEIGRLYLVGIGVKFDEKKGFYWLERAAKAGHAKAQYYYGCKYYCEPHNDPKGEKAAYYLVQSAAQQDPEGQTLLGLMYQDGLGVPHDLEAAFELLNRGALFGTSSWQKFHFGQACYHGWGAPVDYKKAYWWYKRVADLGCGHGYFYLGLMHHYGDGMEQNYKCAYDYFLKAANCTNYALRAEDYQAEVRYILGCYYQKGLHGTQDIDEAYAWLSDAARLGHSHAGKHLPLCLARIVHKANPAARSAQPG